MRVYPAPPPTFSGSREESSLTPSDPPPSPPERPDAPQIPGWPDDLPRLEGPARPAPFVLAGDRAAAVGDEVSGLRSLDLHPFPAVRGMQAGLAPAERVRISSGAAVRHLRDPLRAVESVVLFRRMPAVALQWACSGEGGPAARSSPERFDPAASSDARDAPGNPTSPRTTPLRLAWECPAATPGDGLAPDDPRAPELRLPLGDGSTTLVTVVLGGGARWRVERARSEASPIRIGLVARPDGSDPLTLAFFLEPTGADPAGRIRSRAVRRRLGRLRGVLDAWAGEARREAEEGLVLASSDGEEAGRARTLAWARRRLERSLARPPGGRSVVAAGYGEGCAAPEHDDGAPGPPTPRSSLRDSTPPPAPAPQAVWVGHGLLGVGRHEEARETTARLLEELDPEGDAVALGLTLHLAARCVLWSGSADLLRPANAVVERRLPHLERAARGSDGALAAVAAAAALVELDAAYEAPVRLSAADDVHAAAEALAETPGEGTPSRREERARDAEGSPGGLSLPVVDAAPKGGDLGRRRRERPSGTAGTPRRERRTSILPPPRVLAAVLGVRPPDRPGAGDGAERADAAGGDAPTAAGPASADGRFLDAATSAADHGPFDAADHGFRIWAEWERGRPETARRAWTELLAAGRTKRGLWGRDASDTPGAGCPWHAATTALVAAPLVHGFLGARPDALFGRLRLAPRLGGGWPDDVRFRGLRVGDVRIELTCRRSGGRHSFGLVPLAGRVPLNLVFEPLLPLRRIRTVRVDGDEADVDIHRRGGLSGVRLQLPLDARREVTIEGDQGGDR